MNKADKLKLMSNTANCYYIAYTRCMEQRPIDFKTFQMLPIPALTCLAFSCEVYLKTLLLYFGSSIPNTHDLQKLFDLLPENIRDDIQKAYNNPSKFTNDLDDIKEYFLTSRYLYEEEAGNFSFVFILWLCEKLKEVVDNQIN